MKGRKILTVTVVVLVLMSVSVGTVAGEDIVSRSDHGLTPSASQIGGVLGYSVPDHVITVGADGDPTVFVEYDNDEDFDDLEKWAESEDRRVILDNDEDSNRALIGLPAEDLGTSTIDQVFDRGLYGLDYVLTVDANIGVSNADPVRSLQSEEEYQRPASWIASVGRGSFDQEGVAYSDDSNTTNMSTVRTSLGVDNVTQDGSGVTIAVIDTGLNTMNGSVFGNGTADSGLDRIVHARNTITDEDGLDNVTDGNGHGTWVASAIAANTSDDDHDGIAPGSTIIPIKALDDEGSGSTGDIVKAIQHAKDNNADIIAMSLGSPIYSETIADEITEFLEEDGTAVVVAAGNSRQTTRWIASPADVEGVIGVAATNNKPAKNASVAYFSNVGPDSGADLSNGVTRGEGPDVAAPGMKIEAASVTEGGSRINKSLSGTSMAQPMVSAVIALSIQKNGDLKGKPSEVREWVTKTSEPIPDAGVTEVGDGMIDAEHLVELNETDTDQSEKLNDAAEGRDGANRAISGNLGSFLGGFGQSSSVTQIRERIGI